MSYTIEYHGRFELNKPLTENISKFLHEFSKTRHYQREFTPEEENGKWFVDPEDKYQIDFNDPEYKKILLNCKSMKERKEYERNRWGIIDYNKHPENMPGLWCQWIPTEDNQGIMWDKGEKFYNAKAWLEYIIENYLAPCEYVLNGAVEVKYGSAEYESDQGWLIVHNNKVQFVSDENEFVIFTD